MEGNNLVLPLIITAINLLWGAGIVYKIWSWTIIVENRFTVLETKIEVLCKEYEK